MARTLRLIPSTDVTIRAVESFDTNSSGIGETTPIRANPKSAFFVEINLAATEERTIETQNANPFALLVTKMSLPTYFM